MKTFKEIFEQTVSINNFLTKIRTCQTLAGLAELEKYYQTNSKEKELDPSDDITIRDAIEGMKIELADIENENESE